MHDYYRCVSYYFINFTFAPFFLSLLRAQWIQWLLLSSSSFSSYTHKHIHTLAHPHRQINTDIHKHTHTQTNPHGQTNRETDLCFDWNDQCLWVNGNGFWGGLWQRWCLRQLKGRTQVEEIWPKGSGDWVLFEEWVWVLLVLQWRCLMFILNERGREGARESEGFEIWPRGCGEDWEGEVICVQKWV